MCFNKLCWKGNRRCLFTRDFCRLQLHVHHSVVRLKINKKSWKQLIKLLGRWPDVVKLVSSLLCFISEGLCCWATQVTLNCLLEDWPEMFSNHKHDKTQQQVIWCFIFYIIISNMVLSFSMKSRVVHLWTKLQLCHNNWSGIFALWGLTLRRHVCLMRYYMELPAEIRRTGAGKGPFRKSLYWNKC